eukprot:454696_1
MSNSLFMCYFENESGNLSICCDEMNGELIVCSNCNEIKSHKDHILDTQCPKCKFIDNYSQELDPKRRWNKEDTFRLQIMMKLNYSMEDMQQKLNMKTPNGYQKIANHKHELKQNNNKKHIQNKCFKVTNTTATKPIYAECNNCVYSIQGNENLYHCIGGYNEYHCIGFDLCLKCGKNISKHGPVNCICGKEMVIMKAKNCYNKMNNNILNMKKIKKYDSNNEEDDESESSDNDSDNYEQIVRSNKNKLKKKRKRKQCIEEEEEYDGECDNDLLIYNIRETNVCDNTDYEPAQKRRKIECDNNNNNNNNGYNLNDDKNNCLEEESKEKLLIEKLENEKLKMELNEQKEKEKKLKSKMEKNDIEMKRKQKILNETLNENKRLKIKLNLVAKYCGQEPPFVV